MITREEAVIRLEGLGGRFDRQWSNRDRQVWRLRDKRYAVITPAAPGYVHFRIQSHCPCED